MQFKGKLLLPDEPGPGLSVNLDVAEHHLAVESDGGGLGAWPLEVVDVKRLQGDVFALTVAGEPLQFVADDTIGFAYSGVPTIERVSTRRPRARSALRSMLDWIWNGPDEETPVATDPEPVETPGSREPTEGTMMSRVDAYPKSGLDEDAAEVVTDAAEVVIDADDMVELGQTPPPSQPELAEPEPGVEDLEDAKRCPAIRSDGRRCESPILTSSGYCYPHDPRRAFEDRYQAAQEARAKLKRDATERLNRVYSRLDKAMRQVERGELDPETAMAMAQLARTMCAIVDMDEPTDDAR